jgi:general secretion pathway protein A
MVFLRMKAQPCLLGFFYRRTDGSIGSSSCEFSVREVKPEAPQPPKPEPEAHPEPAPPPKPAAKPALALKPEPAPKPVPARAPEPAPKPKPVLEAAPGPARVVPVQTSLTFWGLGEKPFSRPSAAHLNPRQEDVLSRLMYAIRRRDGLTVLTGEPETGKTTLLERLGDCLSEEAIEFAFLLDPRVSTGQLYEFLAYDLALARGRRSQGDIVESLRELLISQAANGSTVVLLIDDAHNLEWEVLEEIRLLDNLQHRSGRLLQTVLCGSPELDRRLDSEQLRDLRERVAVRCRLQLPSEEETARWIEQQLAECGMPDQTVFSREILSAIFVRSGGVFRVAGAICDALLEACFARGSRIATMEMLDDVWPGLHLTANCD